MPYLTSQLVVRAFQTSGLYSPDIGNYPTTNQLNNGLFLLNEGLSENNLLGEMQKYTKLIEVPCVIGQEIYFIPDMLNIQTFTFNLTNVRYSVQYRTRTEYFGVSRVDQVNGLPYIYHIERAYKNDENTGAIISGSNVYVYMPPSQQITFNIHGLFEQSLVQLNTDLSEFMQASDLKYWRLKLASFICAFYQKDMPIKAAEQLDEIEEKIKVFNSPDLSSTAQIVNLFGQSQAINYGQINIGRGWTP